MRRNFWMCEISRLESIHASSSCKHHDHQTCPIAKMDPNIQTYQHLKTHLTTSSNLNKHLVSIDISKSILRIYLSSSRTCIFSLQLRSPRTVTPLSGSFNHKRKTLCSVEKSISVKTMGNTRKRKTEERSNIQMIRSEKNAFQHTMSSFIM